MGFMGFLSPEDDPDVLLFLSPEEPPGLGASGAFDFLGGGLRSPPLSSLSSGSE